MRGAKPRRGSLLYKKFLFVSLIGVVRLTLAGELADDVARAVANGAHEYRVTGEHEIRKAILLPSDFKMILDGAHLYLAKGSFVNMFLSKGARNVSLVGMNGAVADGGEYNGLGERNAGKDGRPSIWVNNTLRFENVSDFRVEGIKFARARWWALCFVGCSRGVIRNLDFASHHTSVLKDGKVVDIVSRKNYECIVAKNLDGVDIRVGCHDILIENLTGFLEDDSVAVTCLPGESEIGMLPVGTPHEIRDITIRNIRTSSMCSNVRLLAQGGGAIRRVLIDGVEDMSATCPYMTGRGEAGVNIGDTWAYRKPQSRPEDMDEITVRNVRSRALVGVSIRGGAGRVSVENVEGFDGCPQPVYDARPPKVWMSNRYRRPFADAVRE